MLNAVIHVQYNMGFGVHLLLSLPWPLAVQTLQNQAPFGGAVKPTQA